MHKRGLALLIAFALLLGIGIPATAHADETSTTETTTVYRLRGSDRYETAAKVSEEIFKQTEKVVIASGESFPDALAGGQLADALEGPILLTEKSRLPKSTAAELKRLKATAVYILGGTASVSQEVQDELEKNYTVARIQGKDRYETANEIVKNVRLLTGKTPDTTIVSSGHNDAYADALASGSVVAQQKFNLSLSSGQELPEVKTKKWLALGGTKYLPLKEHTSQIERISGADRYVTALELAKTYFKDAKTMVLASGENFADALTAISVSAEFNAPILLTNATKLDEGTKAFIEESCVNLIIVGGEKWIPKDVVKDLKLKSPLPIVTFKANYTDGPEDKVVRADADGKVPFLRLQREDHVFRGWFTNPEGKGNPVDLYEEDFKKDTVLYAKWEAGKEVLIKLDFGYDEIVREYTLKKGETFQKDDPKRDGYVFNGWYLRVGDNEATMDLKTGEKINENMTVKAKWTVGVTITLNYGYEVDEETVVDTITVAKGAKLPSPTDEKKLAPERAGYRFAGWTLKNGSSQDVFTILFWTDTELKANWIEIPVVTLDLDYEGAPEPQTILVGADNKIPQTEENEKKLNPQRLGYAFKGWLLTVNGTDGLINANNHVFLGETTLKAKWEKQVAVKLNPNYPEALQTNVIYVDKGGKIDKTDENLMIERENFTLEGWMESNNGTEIVDFDTKEFLEDTELFAKWAEAAE